MRGPATSTAGRTRSVRHSARALAFACAVLLLAACAHAPAPSPTPEAVCRLAFAALDEAAARFAVQDAAVARIAGFPFLRIDRLLASYRDELTGAAAQAAWVGALAALDAEARAIELAQLPADTRARLATPAHIASCRDRLVSETLADPQRLDALRRAATVPDSYHAWQRVLGAYPILRPVVLAGVKRFQRRKTVSAVGDGSDAPPGRWTLYRTPAETPPPTHAGAPADPLGLPRPDPARLHALFARHAPAWAVDTVDGNDRIGAPSWSGPRLAIDPGRPTEYRYPTYTRFGGSTLLQLNYVIWFPARPKAHAFDLLGGPLDGLTYRVTLDLDGRPLARDAMHNCGCYHLWLPTERLRRNDPAGDGSEPPWVPLAVPSKPSRPLTLYLEPGTHYLRAVGAPPRDSERVALATANYDDLRSLPTGRGGHRSLFGANGIVRESARLERWVLWPLGVPSAGAMRIRGQHATAFVGRRHFDDARLIERYFERR